MAFVWLQFLRLVFRAYHLSLLNEGEAPSFDLIPTPLAPWFLTGGYASPGDVNIFSGGLEILRTLTWKVFEWEIVPSNLLIQSQGT